MLDSLGGASMDIEPVDGTDAILGLVSALGFGGGSARAGLVEDTRLTDDWPLGLLLKPFKALAGSSIFNGIRTVFPLARIAIDSASRCTDLKSPSQVRTTSSIGGAGLGKFWSLQ